MLSSQNEVEAASKIRMERLIKTAEVEQFMEYGKRVNEIPSLNFRIDWNVQIIPPFGNAVVRFYITKDRKKVSVYLDCYWYLWVYWNLWNFWSIGTRWSPYWEVLAGSSTERFDMKDTKWLLKCIWKYLD